MVDEKSKSNRMRKRGKGRSKKVSSAMSKEDAGEQGTSETTTTTPVSSDSQSDSQSHSQSPSLWDRVMDFKPLIGITLIVILPLVLHNAYLFVCLQRPEWLALVVSSLSAFGIPRSAISTRMIILRPSFRASDARRVLVVGTMSSGTTQVAHDLATQLDLEIGHENSETRWSFVRDGTVSWFHGIRFLPRPGIDELRASVDIVLPTSSSSSSSSPSPSSNQSDNLETTPPTTPPPPTIVTLDGARLFSYLVHTICQDLHPNMGFHPFMFRDSGKCSIRESWGKCWKEECANLLAQEWGCALKEESPTCITPYHKTLHQVRHPLKTVESLVTKFCIGGVDGELQPSFVVFAGALFPGTHKPKNVNGTGPGLSCIEAAGYYVYDYTTAMLRATQNGHIDASFVVEGATPCEVAKLAGFFGDEENVHEASKDGYQQRIRDHLSGLCHRDANATSSESENEDKANQPMVSTQNKYNQGQLSLDWDDLLGGKHGSQKKQGDRDLQQRLKKMAKKLGYP